MKFTLHKVWVHLFIAGLSGLIFGIVALTVTPLSLLVLVRLFAGYMILKGTAIILGAWQIRKADTYWEALIGYGLLNIITGIVALKYPAITLIIFGFIVSINLLVGGVLKIVMAIHLHNEIVGRAWLILSGGITLIAGAYIYLIPRIKAEAILLFVAISGLILGIFLISLSLKARAWHGPKPKSIVEI